MPKLDPMLASPILAWLHDLSPVVLRLGGFTIKWYGMSYVAGFAAAWIILRSLARRNAILIPESRVGDAIMTGVMGVLLGGRLGYAVFYDPSVFWTFTARFPWWDLLAIHHGGMSSHGGMIGVIIAAWRISRGFKDPSGRIIGQAPPMHVMDAMAMVVPVGLGLGRLANFVNGELLGRIVALPGRPAPWWAVKFPQEVLSEHDPLVSVPAWEGNPAREQALRAILEPMLRPGESLPEAFVPAYERVLARLQSGDAQLARALEPLISARHPSQLYQAFAECVVVGAVVWLVARRPRRPGVVGCAFLIAYGILRVLTEHWRLPDSHFGVERILGLSRGQWLSVGMVASGLVILAWIRRRGGPAIGGWARVAPAAVPSAPSGRNSETS